MEHLFAHQAKEYVSKREVKKKNAVLQQQFLTNIQAQVNTNTSK